MVLTITHLLNSLLMIGLPLALAATLVRRFGLSWRFVGVGAVTFVVSQLLHIPANLLLGRLFTAGVIAAPSPQWELPVSAAVAGLSAGLFEEGARYAAYRWWARDARSWRKAVLLGCGHGGAESVNLGVLTLVSFIAMFSYRGVDLSTVVPVEQLETARQQIDAYWSMPWALSLLGAVERMLVIPVQIGFSVLVLQAVARNRLRWLFLAALWHAAIDGVIAVYLARTLMSRYEWGPYAVEGAVAVTTAISLGLIWLLRTAEPAEAAAPTGHSEAAPAFVPRVVAETPEKLEDTRFDD